jgi:hypothetical protein
VDPQVPSAWRNLLTTISRASTLPSPSSSKLSPSVAHPPRDELEAQAPGAQQERDFDGNVIVGR